MKRLEHFIQQKFGAFFNRRFRSQQQNMLFIVGHMRSGSTLLVHLLVNHPEIIGYGETHHSYQSPEDFGVVAYRVYRSFRQLHWNERYVLDKVLHSEHSLTPQLAGFASTRTILLIRSPHAALPSIMEHSRLATDELALRYYLDRLNIVQQFATNLNSKQCTFITYEALVEKTQTSLQHLQRFLELPPPHLQEEYQTIWSTGKRYIGDPSKVIKTGRIVVSARNYKHSLSNKTLQQAEAAYQKCIDVCQSYLVSKLV